MIFKTLLVLLLCMNVLSAKEIHVAIASNMSYVMKVLSKEFKAVHPNVDVVTSLGSSGKLTAQIMHGAPYDVFLSADMQFPHRLHDEGFAVTVPKVFAKGALVLLSAKPRDYQNNLDIVKSTEVKTLVMANPKTAPYGKATQEALTHAGLYENIASKLVFGESIAQTTSYAVHIADMGFVAKSSLFNPKMLGYKQNVHWMEVDKKLYTPLKQGIVILKQAKNDKEVQAFYAFMFSPSAQRTLKTYGYELP